MYKLILSQFLVLKCCRSCSAGEKLIFLLHCNALQVHFSAMPFPPWSKPFIASSIGGTTQFLFEKVDNFVKYTDIEIYHTATIFLHFCNHFCPHIFVVLSLPKVEKLEHCMLSCFVSLVPYFLIVGQLKSPGLRPFSSTKS